jgi:hypothetical protein
MMTALAVEMAYLVAESCQGKGGGNMTVTLHLSPETVRRLRDQAAQNGQTLEAYLEELAEKSAGASGEAEDRTPEDWVAEWRSWMASHRRLSTVADDSRESIYADRGE